jgi:hypothetical protein
MAVGAAILLPFAWRAGALRGLLAIRIDPSERVGGSRMIGLAVGAAGVVALLGLDIGGGLALLGAGMILAATGCYAYASMRASP